MATTPDEVKPSPWPRWTARQVIVATLVVAAVVGAFLLLLRFYGILFILFVAIVISTAIRPAVNWLKRRGLPRSAGIILVYLALLALVVGFVLLLAPLIGSQAATIGRILPDAYLSLRERMLDSSNLVVWRLAVELPPALAIGPPEPATGEQALTAVAQLRLWISQAFRALFAVIATLVLAFYWTLDGERTIRALLMAVSAERREEFREIIETSQEKLGSYLGGQALLCVIIGALSLAAYTLIGLPYTLLLAVFAGVMEAVPIVGPLLGAIPAAIVALSLGPAQLVWVLVSMLVIQQLENSLLVPRVMRRAVGVSPIVTLLALVAFGSLFGLVGALVAIPLAAVIQLLLDRYVLTPTATARPDTLGRDHLSVLRYETNELLQDVRKLVRKKEAVADAQEDEVEESLEAIAMDLDTLLAVSGQADNGRPKEAVQ
jgi:predicted PurR-regulated permease PerM